MKHTYIITIAFSSLLCCSITSAKAEPYCFNGPGHNTQKYIGGNILSFNKVKVIAQKKAITDWEKRARKHLNEPVANWKSATAKKITFRKLNSTIVASAYGRYCITSTKSPPHRKAKCPPKDIKCRVGTIKYKAKRKFINPGIKKGLNPQPEPPSRVIIQQ